MSNTGLTRGIDDVRWPELGHAYGPATDVPILLREIAEGDDAVRRRAINDLFRAQTPSSGQLSH